MSLASKDRYVEVNEIVAICPSEVGRDYEECSTEWYHLLASETDFPLLASNRDLKWYTTCRCHLQAGDGSTSHEHVHGLVHFTNGLTLQAFKKRLQRAGEKLHPKTSFKKIICLDHAVGVLRYICCRDGAWPLRKGRNGLWGAPHKHYNRRVWNDEWVHDRTTEGCTSVREQISMCVAKGVSNLSDYTSEMSLHDFNTCRCDRGAIGIQKRNEANEKRRAFYKTERGMEVRRSKKQQGQAD